MDELDLVLKILSLLSSEQMLSGKHLEKNTSQSPKIARYMR